MASTSVSLVELLYRVPSAKCAMLNLFLLGSSVATSLAEGESLKKHVALLQIYKTDFNIVPIPLQTVRPFLFHNLILPEPDSSLYDTQNPSVQAMKMVEKELSELLLNCEEETKGALS